MSNEGISGFIRGEVDFDYVGIVEFAIFKATYMLLPFGENGVLFAVGESDVEAFTNLKYVLDFSFVDGFDWSGKIDPGEFGSVDGWCGFINGVKEGCQCIWSLMERCCIDCFRHG